MVIYDDSKTFIVNDKVEKVVAEIKVILSKDSPYGDIPKLPEMIEQFRDAYLEVLNAMEGPVLASIDDAKKRVFDAIEHKEYKEAFSERFNKLFSEIYEKAKSCNNVATLQNIKVEADALKVRLLNELSKKDEEIAKALAAKVAEEKAKYSGSGEQPVQPLQPKVKKQKNISIKTVNVANSWQIETERELDQYMAALKAQILKELDEDTIIHIEF